MSRGGLLLPALGLGALLLFPAPSWLSAEPHSEEGAISLRGFTGLNAGYNRNPEGSLLSDRREDLLWDLEQRLLVSARPGENSRFDLNLLENMRALANPGPGIPRQAGVERSGLLVWQQHESGNSEANLSVDTAAFHYAHSGIEWSIGRQPVNLATTIYFSPNDFFAPFAAQTFYRAYKPGVDSARVEARLGSLAQLSLVGVLGYAPESDVDPDWRNRPDWSRTSLLARIAANRHDWEWALLGGTVRNHRITGGSLQGELFGWLGVRAEGHYAAPEQEGLSGGTEVSVGLEHRFASNMELRLEQFHHGQGHGSFGEAALAVAAGTLQPGYTGRDYTALGASYEFSPLLTGQALLLVNWSDHSQLLSFNGVYSLSDEAELAMTISFPSGDGPESGSLGSEFGLAPATIGCSIRVYY